MKCPRLARRRPIIAAFFAATLVAVVGCGTASNPAGGAKLVTVAQPGKVRGVAHGGQQPISGGTVSMYAAGTTGTASAARSMLSMPVTTGLDGTFDITGLYTCNPGDQVYLTVTGGSAGGGANPYIALMSGLGPCSALTSGTFIYASEITTVASVWALQAYMSSITNVGAPSAYANALAASFAEISNIVNLSTGSLVAATGSTAVVSAANINSFANSIAACINSIPGTSSAGSCTSLATDSTAGSNVPTNTVEAALNIAQNPSHNVAAIWKLAVPSSPFQPALSAAPSSFSLTPDVLTSHNDNSRDGVQSNETKLTPVNVAATVVTQTGSTPAFGRVQAFPVDANVTYNGTPYGYIYAHPLYVGGVGMPDGQIHNLLLIATAQDNVYVFDADGNNPAQGYLWMQSYLGSGERFTISADYENCSDSPDTGITGTPVIDRATLTASFVTKSIDPSGNIYQRIHVISLLDGTEQANSPQVIAPGFPNSLYPWYTDAKTFNSQLQIQRAALTLTNVNGVKTVWVAFASHCDYFPYHGIVVGYNMNNVSELTATFIDTPDSEVETNGGGGIWMGAGGFATDANGNLYGASGNGDFNANTVGGRNYGDSAFRLSPPAVGSGSTAMTVADYFTPSSAGCLQDVDYDFGGTGPILFQDPSSLVAPNLMIASDKEGQVYLLNADNMGHINAAGELPTYGSIPRFKDTAECVANSLTDANTGIDIQDFSVGRPYQTYNFAFFNNTLYTSTNVKAWTYTPGTANSTGIFTTTASAVATENFPNTSTASQYKAAPVVSANGTDNGIVWAQDTTYGELHALLPSTLAEIYNSGPSTAFPSAGSDAPYPFMKFQSPTIANGKVYVAGIGGVTVYGLK